MAKTSSARTARRIRAQAASRSAGHMVFGRRNYILLVAGVLVVAIGYVVMRVENEVDGFLSLYVAPLLILGGYLEIIYAILWQPKAKTEAPEGEVLQAEATR